MKKRTTLRKEIIREYLISEFKKELRHAESVALKLHKLVAKASLKFK